MPVCPNLEHGIFIYYFTIYLVISGTFLIQAGLGYNNKDKYSLEWPICLLLFLFAFCLPFFTFVFGHNFSTAKTALMCHDLSPSTSEALCGVVTGKCFSHGISQIAK